MKVEVLKECQGELVEPDALNYTRLRQAQPDTPTVSNFYIYKELKKIYECLKLTFYDIEEYDKPNKQFK